MDSSKATPETENKTTPMMQQWHSCKKEAGDALLLFRMGDFYEAFYDDANLLAKELELTLTRRQGIPMSGVPHHTSESYIDKLVSKGYRVAVAEQTEEPTPGKKLVNREIVRIVTPGTLISSSLLCEKTNNFVSAICRIGTRFGLAVLDLTTAEFRSIELESEQSLLNEIYRQRPSECLVSATFNQTHKQLLSEAKKSTNFLLTTHEDWHFDHQTAFHTLINHFQVHSLDGFGLNGMTAGIAAAGALLNYLQDALSLPTEHITEIKPYSTAEYMVIDRVTQKNLELTDSLADQSRRNTLLEILDNTRTPMGGRLMRKWVKQPLLDLTAIEDRQDAVQAFLNERQAHKQLKTLLDEIKDLERLMMKVGSGYATARDLVSLRLSFEPIARIKEMLYPLSPSSLLIQQKEEQIKTLAEMTHLIKSALVDEPPAKISDGHFIRQGYHQPLDELIELRQNSKTWIAHYQTKLRESTGIKTLKVGYNKMFGYYIEVSKGQSAHVPESFARRQTLVNAERYITDELKEYEDKVLNAEEKIAAIEQKLFSQLLKEVARYAKQVLTTAQAIAHIDCLHALAEAARFHDYCRPIVDNSLTLQIIQGRHPVIEAAGIGERFIPNDTLLDDQENKLLIITGPNMAGKSTYIRQVALIAIMAQIGSFVPAKSAHIGIVDKVFSRIGANDDLSRGQSTFMVEMAETANILNNATCHSLVILDEIGRGTSTYDGISIAWSVAEYLLTVPEKSAKTLFATHYWELTKLEEKIPGAKNYNVAVSETEDDIIFLRKIIRGGTDKSYGIHVGRLAGLPKPVILRAKEILAHLEENANRENVFESAPKKKRVTKARQKVHRDQLTLFS